MAWELYRTLKNINSKPLFTAIDDFICQRISRVICSHTTNENVQFNVRRLTADFIKQYVDEKKIESFKIICDKRNNNSETLKNGIMFSISIRYRQINCLNFTELTYEVKQE